MRTDPALVLSVLMHQCDIAVYEHDADPTPEKNREMDLAANRHRSFRSGADMITETFYRTWDERYHCRFVHLRKADQEK